MANVARVIPSSSSPEVLLDKRKAIHDINNMLMSILAHSELLPLRVPDSDEVTNACSEIRTAATKARDYVRKIRDWVEEMDTSANTLPLSAPVFTAPAIPDKRKDFGSILIVDDEPAVLGFVEILLTQDGYDVLTAATSAKAIEIFTKHHEAISLVLADFTMAGLDGAQMLLELARIDPEVPSVISSGFDVSGRTPVREIPTLRGFLDKPFGRDDLLRTIDLAARKIEA